MSRPVSSSRGRRNGDWSASESYKGESPRDSIVSRLKSEIPDDTRDLTARICGDPLPGRSAADRQHQKRMEGG